MNVTVKDAFGGMKKLLAVDPPGVAMVTVDVPVAGAGFGPAAPPEKTAAAVVLASVNGVGRASLIATPTAAPTFEAFRTLMLYCAVVSAGMVLVGDDVLLLTVNAG
jgi:hypothetical protein